MLIRTFYCWWWKPKVDVESKSFQRCDAKLIYDLIEGFELEEDEGEDGGEGGERGGGRGGGLIPFHTFPFGGF